MPSPPRDSPSHTGACNNLCRHYVLGFPGTVSLVYTFHSNLVTYWVLVGATCGYDYYVRYRQGELHAAQLSAELAQAQLQALRTQLQLLAIASPKDLGFGLARMWEALVEPVGWEAMNGGNSKIVRMATAITNSEQT